jgi:hypothetical protein
MKRFSFLAIAGGIAAATIVPEIADASYRNHGRAATTDPSVEACFRRTNEWIGRFNPPAGAGGSSPNCSSGDFTASAALPQMPVTGAGPCTLTVGIHGNTATKCRVVVAHPSNGAFAAGNFKFATGSSLNSQELTFSNSSSSQVPTIPDSNHVSAVECILNEGAVLRSVRHD